MGRIVEKRRFLIVFRNEKLPLLVEIVIHINSTNLLFHQTLHPKVLTNKNIPVYNIIKHLAPGEDGDEYYPANRPNAAVEMLHRHVPYKLQS